jgi:hypothetical protein
MNTQKDILYNKDAKNFLECRVPINNGVSSKIAAGL